MSPYLPLRRVLPHAAAFARTRGDHLALLHVLGADGLIADGLDAEGAGRDLRARGELPQCKSNS